MRRRLIVAILGLAAASCVHERREAKAPVAPATPAPTTNAWDRQIRNAVDAGDGDYQLKALRTKVAAEPDNIPARLDLAKAYRDRGYPDVALEICRLAAERFPQSADVELALVRALRDMNRRPEAIVSLEAFLGAHPQKTASFYSWDGILHDETGGFTAGEPAHRRAIELAPADDSLHNNLGYNLLQQNKLEESAREFREALRLNPSSQTARNNLGLALANVNAAQAIANWQSASDPATAHNNLAAVWIEKGNYAEARKELNIALGYNKTHAAALNNLELVSRLDGNPAAIPANASETRWQRWKTGFKRLFVGPLDNSAQTGAPGKPVSGLTGSETGHPQGAAPVGTTGEER
jgi:Flp pilus assembly protein TadD